MDQAVPADQGVRAARVAQVRPARHGAVEPTLDRQVQLEALDHPAQGGQMVPAHWRRFARGPAGRRLAAVTWITPRMLPPSIWYMVRQLRRVGLPRRAPTCTRCLLQIDELGGLIDAQSAPASLC